MPYHLSGNRVVGADGKTVPGGAHKSRSDALRHMRALYANVKDAGRKEIASLIVEKSVLSSEARSKLPDSAFLVPSERKYPYKTASGKVDPAHLANAAARASQQGKPALSARASRILAKRRDKELNPATVASELLSQLKVKDTGGAVANAGMLGGSGGLFNSPGLGHAGTVDTKHGRKLGAVPRTVRTSNRLPRVKMPLKRLPNAAPDVDSPVRRGTSLDMAMPHINAPIKTKHMTRPVGAQLNPAADVRNLSMDDRFIVYKSGDTYRWLGVSSNSYQDREGELVKQKALEEDVARADATGGYGPLRWWHLGDLSGGVDLGDCDFNMLIGHMLVESGTFKTKEIAERVAAAPVKFELSIAFLPSANDPPDGEYDHINRVERSLIPLPMGRASNPFTTFVVNKELGTMPDFKEKWETFKNVIFGGDETAMKKFVQGVEARDKAIEDAGVKTKEVEVPTISQEDFAQMTSVMQRVIAGEVAVVKKEKETTGEAAAEAKAAGKDKVAKKGPAIPAMKHKEAEVSDDAEVAADAAVEGADESVGQLAIANLTVDEFAELFTDILKPVTDAMREYSVTAEKAISDAVTLKTKELNDDRIKMKELIERLQKLEGTSPAIVAKGYRASQDPGTQNQNPALKAKEVTRPQYDELTTKMVAEAFAVGVIQNR